MLVSVYIRKEDEDKWRKLPKKTEAIHKMLNGQKLTGVVIKETKPTTIPGVVRGADFVPKPPDPETGYPCCAKRSPCKHWQWDSNLTVWVNSLTGKTREG